MDRELRLPGNPGVASSRTEHSGTITVFNIHTSAAIRGVSRETNNKAVHRKSENVIINKLNIDNFRKKKTMGTIFRLCAVLIQFHHVKSGTEKEPMAFLIQIHLYDVLIHIIICLNLISSTQT